MRPICYHYLTAVVVAVCVELRPRVPSIVVCRDGVWGREADVTATEVLVKCLCVWFERPQASDSTLARHSPSPLYCALIIHEHTSSQPVIAPRLPQHTALPSPPLPSAHHTHNLSVQAHCTLACHPHAFMQHLPNTCMHNLLPNATRHTSMVSLPLP